MVPCTLHLLGDMEIYNYKQSNKVKRRVLLVTSSAITGTIVIALGASLVSNLIKANKISEEQINAENLALFAYKSVLRYVNNSSVTYDEEVNNVNSFYFDAEENSAVYCCSNKTSCYTQVVNFSTKLDVEEAINWFANNKTTSMKGILSIETHNYEIDKEIDLTYANHSIDKSIDYISGNEIFTSGTWIDSTGIYSYTSIDKTSLNKESLKNEKVKYKVNSKNLTVDKFYNLLIQK